MLWVRISTHVGDHPRFLEAGAAARDLWSWGMLYAGKHETDGELPMAAVLATPWGLGGKANIKAAMKLVEVGLWERTDSGFRISRWAEQGNETRATMTTKREVGRERKARWDERKRNAVGNAVTNASGSTSISLSGSGSGSDLASPPDWWDPTLAAIEMATGVAIHSGEAWLRYAGHRAGKGIAPTAADAKYWLTTVMVKEARAARDEARHRDDRDKAFDAQRRKDRDGPIVPSAGPALRERADWERTAATPEQAAKAAADLRRLLGKVGT